MRARRFTSRSRFDQSISYLKLDPKALLKKHVSFDLSAPSERLWMHGECIKFEDDFCVLGSVAVAPFDVRTDKGLGFSNIKKGFFRELGIIFADPPSASLFYSSQVVGP